MPIRIDLKDASPYARLHERFASDPDAAAVLTDHRPSTGRVFLLLDRVPITATEIGFYLADADSEIVEICSGPDTTRQLTTLAWHLAAELGLRPIRLATGEPSLLEVIRSESDADDLPGAARLAILLGDALDRGAASPTDIETLLRFARPGMPTPFETLNRVPLAQRDEALETARVRLGRRHLPAGLRRDLRSGTALGERRVRLDISDGIARLRLVRPQLLNALDPKMLGELERSWQEAEESPDVRTIVLEASGPAFMAGVDLAWILEQIESDHLDRIIGFVSDAHALLRRIDACEKLTVAKVHGLAVGAGAEFSAAFDMVIATPRASFGFPETSIGIFPAMGGTQRLPRKIGYAPARWWILGGALINGERAHEVGLVDRFVPETDLEDAVRGATRRSERQTTPAPGFEEFERASLAALRTPGPDASTRLKQAARRMRGRSLVALETADRLLQLSRGATLEEGLAAEITALPIVYSTPEALAGIRRASVGRQTSPRR
jgi:enoyl-CoA hydratase/3-hydroxyacyl-CoA dehydrogenase